MNLMCRLRRALLVALIAAMGGTAVSQTTVTMWTFLNPDGDSPRERALSQIIDNFEAENPDIRINVQPQIWDQMTAQFMAAHGAGNAPDIIWMETDLVASVIELGALADLNELFVDEWDEDFTEDIDNAYFQKCSVDGNQLCFATSQNFIGLHYRADLFEEEGLSPSEINTWDDLLAAAETLTVRDDSGNVERWGLGQQFSTSQADPQLMVPHLLGTQGAIFSDEGEPLWSTEEGVAALEFATSLVTDHGVTPEQAAIWTAEDLYENFAAGQLAMITAASVRVPSMRQALGAENVGFMGWPSVDGQGRSPGVALGWFMGVWSGSDQMEEAGQFLEYMVSPEADEIWVTEGGQVPLRQSTVEALGDYFSQPENAFVADVAALINEAAWLAPNFEVAGWHTDLNAAAQNVLAGNSSAPEALERAETEFTNRHR